LKLIHQGFEYYITKDGNAVFPEQNWKVKPTAKLTQLILEPHDTITFEKSVVWLWKDNKFIIKVKGMPWLFAYYKKDRWYGILQS